MRINVINSKCYVQVACTTILHHVVTLPSTCNATAAWHVLRRHYEYVLAPGAAHHIPERANLFSIEEHNTWVRPVWLGTIRRMSKLFIGAIFIVWKYSASFLLVRVLVLIG